LKQTTANSGFVVISVGVKGIKRVSANHHRSRRKYVNGVELSLYQQKGHGRGRSIALAPVVTWQGERVKRGFALYVEGSFWGVLITRGFVQRVVRKGTLLRIKKTNVLFVALNLRVQGSIAVRNARLKAR